jgi:hypothetical protein
MAQLCYFCPELAYFPLQGLSDIGTELRHIILTQIHVLLAIVRLQTLYFLPVLLAIYQPPAASQQRKESKYDVRKV